MNRRTLLLSAVSAGAMPRVALAAPIDDAVRAVGDAAFIAIGERHDNPEHHRVQAALVAELRPASLAFEMIPQDKEALVNAMRVDGVPVSEIGAALEWEASGWPDWHHYAQILEAAPDAYIAGGGLSKAALGQLYAQGAQGLGPEMTERYGLGDALPDELLSEMLEEQYNAHCELIAREKLGAMVEVQRAWDASYAETWRRAAQAQPGRSVLICGNAHARLDRGAPAYLLRAEPDVSVASIGLLEDGDPATQMPFTATLSAPAPDREDPCEQMRKAMGK